MARLRRSIDAYGITTRTLEVLRVADVTPGMRRVTMGGPQLAAHIAPNGNPVAAFRSDGFDDAIEVVLDRPDQPRTDRPTQGRGVVRWPRDGAHILSRAYT
ncbi:MAG: siderophore-interacting protein, partial [Peptidiphaga sp.]